MILKTGISGPEVNLKTGISGPELTLKTGISGPEVNSYCEIGKSFRKSAFSRRLGSVRMSSVAVTLTVSLNSTVIEG